MNLLDARTGLLLDVAASPRRADMPAGWTTWGASVARTQTFAPWRADAYGFGASLGDPTAARGAAVGEAVERYCGNAVPDRFPRESTSFSALDVAALDPSRLAL